MIALIPVFGQGNQLVDQLVVVGAEDRVDRSLARLRRKELVCKGEEGMVDVAPAG